MTIKKKNKKKCKRKFECENLIRTKLSLNELAKKKTSTEMANDQKEHWMKFEYKIKKVDYKNEIGSADKG